jgi:catalase (peroxidase I)
VTTCNEDRDVNYKAFLEPLVLGFRIFRPWTHSTSPAECALGTAQDIHSPIHSLTTLILNFTNITAIVPAV